MTFLPVSKVILLNFCCFCFIHFLLIPEKKKPEVGNTSGFDARIM